MNIIRRNYKKFLAGVLIIGLGIFAIQHFGGAAEGEGEPTYSSTELVVGDIRDSISVSGQAELVDEQKLRFNQTGKVVAVHFSDGQAVKQDDVIAELDKSDLENEIKQSQISLQNSKITLQDLLDGNDESVILKAENSVSQLKTQIGTAEKNLEILKNTLSTNLEDLDKQLDLAKQSYEIAKSDYDNALVYESQDLSDAEANYQKTLSNASVSASGIIVDVEGFLDEVNKVMGIDGNMENYNDGFEDYLGATDYTEKSRTKYYYSSARSYLSQAQNRYNEIQNSDDLKINDVLDLFESEKNMVNSGISMLDSFYNTLDASVAGGELTDSQISSYKSSANSMRSSAKNLLDSIQSQITNLKTLEDLGITEMRSNDTITQAQYNLQKSEVSYENLNSTIQSSKDSENLKITEAENSLTNLRDNLAEAEIDLQDAKDGADEEDIAKARNDVTTRELALEKVKDGVDNYEIIAPFDGIVRDIDYKVGDNILSDDEKYVYIENPDLLKITIALDQIDIVKVGVGQSAQIIFDAFPELTFEGYVEEVNQTPDTTSGVVTYPVSITLDKGENKIFSGMTAEVEIITSETTDVLLVPASAITIDKDGKKTVLVQKEKSRPEIVEITTGESDGTNTEVLSGLNVGDVVLEIQLNIDTSALSSGGMRMGGGGMRM